MEAERRNEMASEGEMYRVIKLLLYIFLNSRCSPGVGEGFTLVKDKYASGNFSLRGKIPRYTSRDLARRNFLENEKLFRQQVKRNFGSSHFDDVPAHAVTKVCSIKLEQQDDS